MNKVISTLILIFGAMFFNSCSTDFDMYADYKDVTIVYGIADVSDDTTWVKITKAFTGPGNALLLAQNPDSSNYPYKLDAYIEGKKNGIILDRKVLDTITIHNKAITETIINDEGDTIILNPFYSPNQLMYYAVGIFDNEANYTLTINKNDEILTASTGVVNEFGLSSPRTRITFIQDQPGKIKWFSTTNGKRYEVSLRFNYSEYAAGYSDTLKKSVNWFLGVENSKTDDGGEELVKSYEGSSFFNLLVSELETIPNVERWAEKIDITIACGSQELATYLDINSGGATLLEEVPAYSNIEGGTGIFASRYTLNHSVDLATTSERVLILDYNLGFKYK